jgi:hypothetical protein
MRNRQQQKDHWELSKVNKGALVGEEAKKTQWHYWGKNSCAKLNQST